MTVTSAANKQVFAGNGAQVAFAFTFNNAWDGTAANLSAALANLAVLYTDASGNQTTVAQGAGATQCQIALNAPVGSSLWGLGGTVTYNPNGTPIATGTTLTVLRTLPLTQATSLQNQASYGQLASSFEKSVDLLEMQTQQEAELYGRAIVVNPADANAPTPLPPAAQRAGLALLFDANGNPIAGQAPAGGVISSAMAAIVSAASVAAARALMGLGSAALEAIGLYGLADDGAGNLRQSYPITADATNQTVTSAYHLTFREATGPISYALPRANTLWNGFGFWVAAAAGGDATLTINAADSFANGISGAAFTVPLGSTVFVSTNAANAGLWTIRVMPGNEIAPQGYLTPTSNTPIIPGDVIGASTIFYTPFVGRTVPVFNGSQFVNRVFAQLSLALSGTLQAADTLYDVFAFDSGGALTLGFGPAWTTSTPGSSARGTGAGTTQLARLNGIWTNANQITLNNGASTFTVPVNQATYLGSIYTDHTAGQVTCHRSSGQNRKWGVWNAYNRVPVVLQVNDPTVSWTVTGGPGAAASHPATYTSTVFNVGSGTAANGATVLAGLAEEAVEVTHSEGGPNNLPVSPATAFDSTAGIGVNTISAFSGQNMRAIGIVSAGSVQTGVCLTGTLAQPPTLGLTVFAAVMQGGSASWTFTTNGMLMTARFRA